jgi:hypothetical protein
MSLTVSKKSQAYVDGYRNGRLDRSLGIRSDYSFYSTDSANEYVREYSKGYRRGLLGLSPIGKETR